MPPRRAAFGSGFLLALLRWWTLSLPLGRPDPPSGSRSLAFLVDMVAAGNLLSSPIADGDVAELVKLLSTDVRHLLETKGIPKEVQAQLSKKHIRPTATLATMADEDRLFRSWVVDNLGLNAQHDEYFALVSNLVNTWLAASVRSKRWLAEEAEHRATGRPRIIPNNDMALLAQAYLIAHKIELKDKQTPAKYLIEDRLAQLEDGALIAEQLNTVVSLVEGGNEMTDAMQPGTQGSVRIVQVPKKVTVRRPRDMPELDLRIKLLATVWEFCRLKVPQNTIFDGLDKVIWGAWVEYLKGDLVSELEVKTSAGATVCKPSFWSVQEYEFFMRKAAYRLTAFPRCLSLAEAMKEVMKDQQIYQQYFSIPVSTSAGVIAAEAAARGATQAFADRAASSGEPRRADDFGWEDIRPPKRQRGGQNQNGNDRNFQDESGKGARGRGSKGRGKGQEGRGRGQDKGRGRGNQDRSQGAPGGGNGGAAGTEASQTLEVYRGSINAMRSFNKTSDGAEKCYKWNSGKQCDGNCGRVHACLLCGKPHTMKWHKSQMSSAGHGGGGGRR